MNYPQRSSTHLIHVTLLIVSFALTSCAPIDINKAARGYWTTVAGKVPPSQDAIRIYDYDWYAIEAHNNGTASVTWDNGIACAQTNGRIEGNEIHLTADDVATTFVFQDDSHATVTFHRGQTTYVKQLKKIRDDPRVGCL